MSQLTIYVPDNEARAIRQGARREKLSLSEWARVKLSAGLKATWPAGYSDLFGALKDDSMQRPPQTSSQDDTQRKAL